jgi:hypothetical protein
METYSRVLIILLGDELRLSENFTTGTILLSPNDSVSCGVFLRFGYVWLSLTLKLG